MTALPSNLAFVGDDLARATSRDARRAARRRRAVTVSLALALLVVTATAAVANGWLFGQTTTLRAVPSLGAGGTRTVAGDPSASAAGEVASAETRHRAGTRGVENAPPLGSALQAQSQTLLTGLGPQGRVLSSVPTTSGGVCFTLTGFPPQCTPTFGSGQQVDWISGPSGTGTTLIWGIARDDVAAIAAVSAAGEATPAVLANNGFYIEVASGKATQLEVHLRDGTSEVVPLFPCPPTTPTCTS